MPDFTQTEINIRYLSDNWGPYAFDFSDVVPTGDTIQSVAVDAYIGNVKSKSTLTDFTEIPYGTLVENGTEVAAAPAISTNTVTIYFRYPGDTYKGDKVTLIFELTMNSGATHPFYFQYVKIR